MSVSTNNGLVNGLVHNLPLQFFTLDSSKSKFLKLIFLIFVITSNAHPRYVKHVLGCIYVFFTLFGYWVWGGGGVPRGLVHNLLM